MLICILMIFIITGEQRNISSTSAGSLSIKLTKEINVERLKNFVGWQLAIKQFFTNEKSATIMATAKSLLGIFA